MCDDGAISQDRSILTPFENSAFPEFTAREPKLALRVGKRAKGYLKRT
jgi:hypothetical protein